MVFWQYLQKTEQAAQGLTEGLATRFTELMSRGHSVADLLAHYDDEFGHLPAEQLQSVALSHRNWQQWRRRKTKLDEARTKAKLPRLPADALVEATSPDKLDAMARCARLCPRSTVSNEGQWCDVLRAGVQLWCACIRLARKAGTLRCTPTDAHNPENEQYDAYIGTTIALADVAPYRWLAVRRGRRHNTLQLSLDLPRDSMQQQAELFHARLAVGAAAERTPLSLLEELVLDDLEPWLLSIIDTDAECGAIRAACDSLSGLLRSAPVQARRIGALYLGRGKAAAAAIVADREGELVAQRVIKPEGQWLARVIELFEEHKAHAVVLPSSGPAPELTAAAETKLAAADLQIDRVRSAALSEARRPLSDPPLRLTASVASALVLARRALDPLKAWAAVDPVSIGIAEYQNDLDQDRLRTALVETVELCRLERRRTKSTNSPGAAVRATGAMARLNPLVKSIGDLRPGMSVHGLVTNISHFGVFVGIGLPQEALVHISELSDEFVTNPNEVVRIGQQVTAQVLSCDPVRGRISLSMKTRSRKLTVSPGRGDGDNARARPATRADALANLERLFKK